MLNLFNTFFADENEKEKDHNFGVDLIHLRNNLTDAITRLKNAVNEFKVGFTEEEQAPLTEIAEATVEHESVAADTLPNITQSTVTGD
jgi:hypothetical protein